MQTLFALVDCNNFYVSCERVFRPDLIGKPVAVLSNNDGCIVARSQEVKDLGIKMAVPLFQVEQIIQQHKVHLFSSNYTLYADMSARVMTTLEEFAPKLEIYSIDEAFLDLTNICNENPTAYGKRIKKQVYKNTGIPVCVGIASSKTLAKLANYAAKKWKQTGGVLDLSNPVRREKLLAIVPVNEVWGIGSRTSKRLNELGIYTAGDLASQPYERIKKQFNIAVARTVLELNGIQCLDLEDIAPDKQQIVCSRSFSRRLTTFAAVFQALAEYCGRAAEKLRQQKSVTGCVSVFIRTNVFALHEAQYQRMASCKLHSATQDTRIITSIAHDLLLDIFKTGYAYHKCGVQFSHIQPACLAEQLNLFSTNSAAYCVENRHLMKTIDGINRRFPKGVSILASGFDKSWHPAAERISQAYTTHWQELVKVMCK